MSEQLGWLEIVAAGFKQGDGDSKLPSVFIQWKGTDVCMDFYCECRAACHFDGDFAYVVTCPHCGQKWEMPHTLYPRKVCSKTYPAHIDNAKMMESDEGFAAPPQPTEGE